MLNPFATMCAPNAQNGGPGGGAPWRVPRGGTQISGGKNERGGPWLSPDGNKS